MIRKISIGPDYKNAMHYHVGQTFGPVTIDTIRKEAPLHYAIYVRNDLNEISLWKEIVGMPVVVEKDLNAFS